jgi:hypothetical protein
MPEQSPHERRSGRLKNGNRSGDLSHVRHCGAKTRRGTACQCPSMRNGRCRLHGGLSTGPKTVEGRDRIRKAVTKHGRYSAAAKARRRASKTIIWSSAREFSLRRLLESVHADIATLHKNGH